MYQCAWSWFIRSTEFQIIYARCIYNCTISVHMFFKTLNKFFSRNDSKCSNCSDCRGGVIEDEDGGVVTENLHKPSQEKYNPHFSGSTIQSRSFHILEENLAAGNWFVSVPLHVHFYFKNLEVQSWDCLLKWFLEWPYKTVWILKAW